MKIIDKFLMAKTGTPEDCEDAIFVNEHFIVVIDGVTAKSSFLQNDKKPGRVAAELILDLLPTFEADISASKMFTMMNECIVSFYKKNNLFEHMKANAVDRFTIGGVAVYSKYFGELWFLGDCQALMGNKKINNEWLIDFLASNIRSFIIETEILAGKTVEELLKKDTGRQFILPIVQKEASFQNLDSSEYSYACIDGFFHNTSKIEVVTIPNNTTHVVLASDGYPILFSSLEQTEEKLAEILKNDPLMYKEFKSTKGLVAGNVSYDDRAYIKFSLEEGT